MIKEIKGGDISNDKLTMLVYGAPGSGKTWFAGHMPKPYFISLDRGLIGLKKHKVPIQGVEIETYDEALAVVYDLTNGKRGTGCETLVLDHLTVLGEMALETALKQQNKTKADLHTWGVTVDKVRFLIKLLLDLSNKFHILVLSHEQIEKNELRGGVFGTPATIGKFAYHVGGLFDCFFYTRQESEWKTGKQIPKWVVHTTDYVDFKAKDRLGVLDVVEPNDPSVILGKIYS